MVCKSYCIHRHTTELAHAPGSYIYIYIISAPISGLQWHCRQRCCLFPDRGRGWCTQIPRMEGNMGEKLAGKCEQCICFCTLMYFLLLELFAQIGWILTASLSENPPPRAKSLARYDRSLQSARLIENPLTRQITRVLTGSPIENPLSTPNSQTVSFVLLRQKRSPKLLRPKRGKSGFPSFQGVIPLLLRRV